MVSIGTLTIDFLVELLASRLSLPLPGLSAQLQMAPAQRRSSHNNADPGAAQPSSVLILLFQRNQKVYTAFIQRTETGPHGGQISLPGGRREPNDQSGAHTALRETEEEIGIQATSIKILGEISSLYVSHSNYCIRPFVGWINYDPVFSPDPSEVVSVLSIPLSKLFNQASKREDLIQAGSYRIHAPYYSIDPYKIWGATAMIMSEFELIVGQAITETTSGIYE